MPSHLLPALRGEGKDHKAALAHGGKDNGAPGERPYHPGYYAAFVRDPDGNTIEAVYHGASKRSAASVKVCKGSSPAGFALVRQKMQTADGRGQGRALTCR